MEMNLNNLKAEYSKSLITDAFYSLIEKKPIQEISITQIAEKAGVSRMAFYRNFKSKEDVVFTYCDRIRREFFRDISALKDTPDLYFLLNRMFAIRESHRDACVPVYRDSFLYYAFNRSCDFALSEGCFFSQLSYTRERVVRGAMYYLLVESLEGNNKFNKEEAIGILMELILGREKAKEHIDRSLL